MTDLPAIPVGQMRVLVLGPCSPHTLDMALEVHRRGHVVQLLSATDDPTPPPELVAAGIPFHSLRGGANAVLGLVKRARAARALVREMDADVVHAHVLSSDPFVAVAAGLRPLVATAWGSDVLLATRAASWRNRVVARRADALTADSPSLRARLVSLGAPSERVALINWGVNLERFSPGDDGREELRARLGLPAGPLVLSARAYTPVYNIDTVVAAFSIVAEADPTVNLLVKTHGGTTDVLPDSPHADRIHTFGRVPLDRLIDFYRAADVSVSIPSSDSSPRTVWESLACGCPCVVSRLDWIDGMITADEDALVVGPDAREVATAVRRVLDDRPFAEELSARGRRLVEAHHDRAVEMDRLVALYEQVIRRRTRRHARG